MPCLPVTLCSTALEKNQGLNKQHKNINNKVLIDHSILHVSSSFVLSHSVLFCSHLFLRCTLLQLYLITVLAVAGMQTSQNQLLQSNNTMQNFLFDHVTSVQPQHHITAIRPVFGHLYTIYIILQMHLSRNTYYEAFLLQQCFYLVEFYQL